MRWKISPHGHDPRQVDLLTTLALLVIIAIIVTIWHHFSVSSGPQNTTAFIVPSQSVRW